MDENTTEDHVIPPSASEDRAVRATVALDGALQKQITRKPRRVYFLFLLVGAAVCIAYIAVAVCADEGVIPASKWYDVLLWAGAVLFATGLVCTVMFRRAARRAEQGRRLVNRYAFVENGFVVETVCGEETVAVARLQYADCWKIREDKLFFLLYQNRSAIFPVRKSELSGEDAARLRTYLRLPPRRR